MRADVRARSPWRPGAGLAGNCSRGAAARAGAMAKLLSCVLGPRLYKVYRERYSERRPEAPASVTAPSPSSWVSRGLPPWRHGTARAPLGLAPRKRPLWEIGGACLSSQLCAQAAWCFRVQSCLWTGHPEGCLPSPPPSPGSLPFPRGPARAPRFLPVPGTPESWGRRCAASGAGRLCPQTLHFFLLCAPGCLPAPFYLPGSTL